MLDPAGQKTDIITEEPNGAINDQLIKVAKIVIESSRIVASSLGNLSNRQVIIAIFLQDMLGRLNKKGSLSNFGVLKCLCTPGEDMH